MIRDVVKAMDKNGDEVIQYDGTCRETWHMSANPLGDRTLQCLVIYDYLSSSWDPRVLQDRRLSNGSSTLVVSSESLLIGMVL